MDVYIIWNIVLLIGLFIFLIVVIVIIFIIWEVFVLKWEVEIIELIIINLEWFYGCFFLYYIFEEFVFVKV